MTTKNKGGRPKSYTADQVLFAIERVEANGEDPNGNNVKSVLCGEFGVSSGINGQSLEAEILRLLDVRRQEAERDLADKLPEKAKTAAASMGQEIERSVLRFLAHENADLRSAAREGEAAKEEDLLTARARIRELEAQVVEDRDLIARLEANTEKLDQKVAAQATEIIELRGERDRSDRDASLKTEILTMMQEAFERRVAGQAT